MIYWMMGDKVLNALFYSMFLHWKSIIRITQPDSETRPKVILMI